MATADLSGLFGGVLTPEEQQRQLTEARAAQFAELAPSQQLAFMGYKAGAGLGQGLAQAAGVDIQDPAIKRATMLRQLAQGIDVTSIDGLQQYAARLQQAGFNAEANQLGQQILAARKTESEITRNERERKGLDPFEQLLRTGKYTPASLAKYKKSGDPADLEPVEKPAKAQIKEVGVAETTREPVYTYQATPDSEPRQVIYKTNAQGEQVMVPYSGGVDRTTSKTKLDVKLPEGESEFVKRLGVKDAERVDAAITARETAATAIRSLNKLASLPSDQLISGQFATGRVGATNLLTTLGLVSPEDASRLATSQQYQKVAGDVILSTLGGRLGSGFSNADRDFIASLVPQLETNPEARRQLIKYMQTKNQEIIDDSQRLEDYARENRGLKGFKYKIPFLTEPSKANPYSGLSDSELAQRIAAARAAQGK